MNSNPFSGIPVYIDKKHHDKYKQFVERKSERALDYPFATMKDLFIVAACAGAHANKYQPVKSARDIFSGETFDKDIDIPLLFTLAYKKETNVDILLEPKIILEIAQGWANGGIEILEENILGNPGRPLNNFVNWLFDINE